MSKINQSHQRRKIRKPTNTFRIIKPFLEVCRSRSDNTYIKRPLEEQDIRSFLNDKHAARCLILGHTGIGKSTLLDHCLPLPMKRSAVVGDTLCILIRFDRAHPANLENEYGAYFRDAYDVLQQEYGIGPDSCADYKSELVRYVKQYRGFLLQIGAQDLDEYASDSDRYEHFRRHQTLRFPLVALKYWVAAANTDPRVQTGKMLERPLRKDGKRISSIVIVIDDIEGDQNSQPDKHISIAFTAHECLANQEGIPPSLRCKVKTIVGIRKTTLAVLRDNHDDFLGAYRRPRLIDLENIPPICELFDSYKSLIGDKSDQSGWADNYEVVKRIARALETRNGNLMALLANYDIRRVMNAFCEVLCDSEHFADDLEGRMGSGGAFKVKEYAYKTQSRVAFTLALGYQGHNLYDASANDEAYIPNVLSENGSFIDFIDFYLLVHAQHLRRAFDLTLICPCFSRMTDRPGTDDELKKDVNASIARLIRSGLLIDETYLNLMRGNSDDRCFALMPRGEGLLTAMRMDSAILELYRDDCHLFKDKHTTQNLRQYDIDELTADVCELAEIVANYDFTRLRHLQEGNDLEYYKRCFGGTPASNHVLKGFAVAVNKFIKSGDTSDSMRNVQRRVEQLSKSVDYWISILSKVPG